MGRAAQREHVSRAARAARNHDRNCRGRREWHERHRRTNRQRHVSPAQRRKVRNGPRPANRAAAEATLRALDPSHPITITERGEYPKCRFAAHPAHARRGPFLTRHPPWCVRSIQLAVTPLALRAKLRCACHAASGAPANSMALGAPRRRRRCSRPARCRASGLMLRERAYRPRAISQFAIPRVPALAPL